MGVLTEDHDRQFIFLEQETSDHLQLSLSDRVALLLFIDQVTARDLLKLPNLCNLKWSRNEVAIQVNHHVSFKLSVDLLLSALHMNRHPADLRSLDSGIFFRHPVDEGLHTSQEDLVPLLAELAFLAHVP